MPIEHFKIINEDGTTNQAEYNRCIEFLNSYIDGTIPVYPETTWTNPFEIDLSQQKSAYTLIKEIVEQPTNKKNNTSRNGFKPRVDNPWRKFKIR